MSFHHALCSRWQRVRSVFAADDRPQLFASLCDTVRSRAERKT
jgi:hypothetical protein